MPLLDLIVRAGLVVDGSGPAPFTADIAVHEGSIVEIGRVPERARRVIDADGALVIPGLIALMPPPSVAEFDRNRQHHLAPGVTTTVELIPGSVSVHQIPRFLTTAGPLLIDRAVLVSHDDLRLHTMGNKVRDELSPSGGEIELMAELLADAVSGGAVGLTSTLTGGPDELNRLVAETNAIAASRDLELAFSVMLEPEETDPSQLVELGRYVATGIPGSVVIRCADVLEDPDLVTALTIDDRDLPHAVETQTPWIVGPGKNPLALVFPPGHQPPDYGSIAAAWRRAATAFDLNDRGAIAIGKRGDLNVLDHVHLSDDLTTGVVSTLLGGSEIVSFDELTGASPGTVSRPGQRHG